MRIQHKVKAKREEYCERLLTIDEYYSNWHANNSQDLLSCGDAMSYAELSLEINRKQMNETADCLVQNAI